MSELLHGSCNQSRHALHDSLHAPAPANVNNPRMDHKAESGRRLRAARKRRQLTLEGLAALLPGYSYSRIANYERGERGMDQADAEAIAEALNTREGGVTAAYLMCYDDAELHGPTLRIVIEAVEEALLERRRQMSPAHKAELIEGLYILARENPESLNRRAVLRLVHSRD